MTLHFSSEGNDVPWQVFNSPVSNGKVIVIGYGSAGMVDPWKTEIERYAQKLADESYTVFIPDYLAVTDTPYNNPRRVILDEMGANRDTWANTIRNAISAAQDYIGVAKIPSNAGLLGFSAGGDLCLLNRDKVSVIVSFFSPYRYLMHDISGHGANSNANLHAQLHHGDADGVVLVQDSFDTEDELNAESIYEVDLITYSGATHGFATGLDADEAARNDSFDRTVQFFMENL